MSRKFLVSIDLNKNELQNAVIQNLATAPASPSAGQMYYNTNDNELYYFDGSIWVSTQAESEVLYGTLAARPAAGVAGRLYYATDNYLLYFDDGSTWTQVNNFGSVTAETSYGAGSSNGTSTNFARADHTHGTPPLTSVTPQALAIGSTGAVGTGTAPSREDHVHDMPDFGTVVAQTTFGAGSADGTSVDVSHADHTHGTPVHDNAAHATINLSALDKPLTDVSFDGKKITNLATPTNSTDAANKQYVDDIAQGLHIHASVVAATTASLTATYNNGTSGVGATLTNSGTPVALVIDGVTVALGDRVLVKDQASPATQPENGIYVVSDTGSLTSNWILTRATDFDTSAEIQGGDFVFVTGGTQYDNTGWVQTNTPIVVGTSPIVWQQFSGAGTYTASNGVQLTGSNFSGVVVAGGGLTVGATGFEIDTAVVVRKYAASIGDGASTSIPVTHNLGTQDVIVSVYDNSAPNAEVICDVLHTSTTKVTLQFSVAPTTNQYRVVVHA